MRARLLSALVAALMLASVAAGAQEPSEPEAPEPAQPEEAPLRLSARVGFADRSRLVKVNRWNPVYVELENRAKKKDQGVKGWIRIVRTVPAERTDDTSSLTPIELPPLSKKLLVIPELIEANDDELRVELVIGREVAVADGMLLSNIMRMGERGEMALVLSSRPHALGWLENRPRERDDTVSHPIRLLLETATDQLPREWIAWDGADILLVDDPETLVLDAEQVVALRTFVRLGGVLVVAAGRNFAVLAESALAPLLPASIEGAHIWQAKAATPAADLAAALHAATGLNQPLGADAPGVALKRHRGRVLASAGGVPLAIEEQVGLGRIVQLSFAISEPVLLRSEAARAFVRECFGRVPARVLREPYAQVEGVSYDSPVPGYDYGDAPGNEQRLQQQGWGVRTYVDTDPNDFGWRDVVESAFQEDLLTRIPAWRTVFLFLLAYFLVMVPGCMALFRVFQKLEWAWPAMVLVAAAFSGLAYVHGLRGGASSLLYKHLTVIHAGSGSPEGRAVDLVGLASPGHVQGDFRFDHAERYVTRMRTRGAKRGFERESVVRLRLPQGPVLQDFRVLARAIRGVEIQRTLALGEGVTVRTERHPAGYSVRVVNGTQGDLRAPLLVLGRMTWRPDDEVVAAGEERLYTIPDAELKPGDVSLGPWIEAADPLSALGPHSRRALWAVVRNEVRGPLAVSLLAMLDEPGFEIAFDGQKVAAAGTTLLAVRAETALLPGPFAVPAHAWQVRVASVGLGGCEWEAGGGSLSSRADDVVLAIEPLFWTTGATVRTGSCTLSLQGSDSKVDAHALPWPFAQAPRDASQESRVGSATGGTVQFPLDRRWVHPRSGGFLVRLKSEHGLSVSLAEASVEGVGP